MKITVWTFEGEDRWDRIFAWLTGGGVMWTAYNEDGKFLGQGWARKPSKAIRKAKRELGIYGDDVQIRFEVLSR